jgi:hypothetical protein
MCPIPALTLYSNWHGILARYFLNHYRQYLWYVHWPKIFWITFSVICFSLELTSECVFQRTLAQDYFHTHPSNHEILTKYWPNIWALAKYLYWQKILAKIISITDNVMDDLWCWPKIIWITVSNIWKFVASTFHCNWQRTSPRDHFNNPEKYW